MDGTCWGKGHPCQAAGGRVDSPRPRDQQDSSHDHTCRGPAAQGSSARTPEWTGLLGVPGLRPLLRCLYLLLMAREAWWLLYLGCHSQNPTAATREVEGGAGVGRDYALGLVQSTFLFPAPLLILELWARTPRPRDSAP